MYIHVYVHICIYYICIYICMYIYIHLSRGKSIAAACDMSAYVQVQQRCNRGATEYCSGV